MDKQELAIYHADGRITPIVDLERSPDEIAIKIGSFGAFLTEECRDVNQNLRAELFRQISLDIQSTKEDVSLSGVVHRIDLFASDMSTPGNRRSIAALRNHVEDLALTLFFGKESNLKEDEEVKKSVHELHLHELELIHHV